MPQEETVAPATPADRRRRRNRGLAVLALFIVVVLCGLTATVLAVNEGRNYKRLLHEAGIEPYLPAQPAAPKIHIGRQRRLPPGPWHPQRLLDPAVSEIADLLRPVAPSPEDRCRKLGQTNGEPPKFIEQAQEWECTWLEQFSDMPDAASIFVQAKGSTMDGLRTFRVKLSFTEADKARAIETQALSAIDRFDLSLSTAARNYLGGRIEARTPFKSSLENYRAIFSQEIMDTRRFNLVLVAQGSSATCAEGSSLPDVMDERQLYQGPLGCLTLAKDRPFSLPL